jgi:hypothetical protein
MNSISSYLICFDILLQRFKFMIKNMNLNPNQANQIEALFESFPE